MISGTSDNNLPSLQQDPALSGSLTGAFAFAIEQVIKGLSNRLPGQIMAYDRNTNRAQVQILIPLITTSGAVVPRAQIASIPAQIDGGGGIFISFPLKNGDLGWVEACDRDISLFLQTYQQAAPNTYRYWNFADSKFTPSVMTGYTIDILDTGAAVISTLDGTVRISIAQTGITITTPTLTVDGALVLSGGITSPEGVSGVTIYTGNLAVVGNITATGLITPDTPPP
jgi:hypothetical protein